MSYTKTRPSTSAESAAAGIPACLWPFTSMAVNDSGDVFLCPCVQWTRMKAVGNIFDQPLADIWNAPAARRYRECFHAGRHHTICDTGACPYLLDFGKVLDERDYLNPELNQALVRRSAELPLSFTRIKLDTDLSCNLRCVMCRKEKVAARHNPTTSKALERLAPHWPHIRELSPATAGEALFIPEFRDLLRSPLLEDHQVGVELVTNGTLLTERMWQTIAHNRFLFVKISMDSLDRERYERIRRGADFQQLQKNLELIARLRKAGRIEKMQLTAVVMRSNLDELKNMVHFTQAKGFDKVKFLKLNGDLTPDEKLDPQATKRLQSILEDPIFKSPQVDLWGLLPYRTGP